jgi:NADH-quinone oxidoreductase subunit L
MPDYAGSLQRLVFSRTLWLIVAWPLAGFAWQAMVARGRMARATSDVARRRARGSARNAGLACIALSAVSTLAHAAVLSRTPDGARALFQSIALGGRVGSLDAQVDLWFDPLSATFCSLACLVALAASAVAATNPQGGASPSVPPSAPRDPRVPPPLPRRGPVRVEHAWQTWAWLQLSLAGALLSFLADGFIGTAMGWTMAGAAVSWLAGWHEPSSRAAVIHAVRGVAATSAMLLGTALLFWGLGGAWDGDDYVPDLEPRFTPVRAGAPSAAEAAQSAPGSGWLTLTSVPGALVFLGDSRTPLARAPFVAVPVPSGPQTVRVRRPDMAADEVLGRVTFSGGEEIVLVPVGPTLSFRAIADQLVVRTPEGDLVARRDIEGRAGPGGAAVVAASMLAFLVAAWGTSGASSPPGAPRALAALTCTATTAMLGPYLLARLSFLFALTPYTWAAVESIGAASLLAAAWYAPGFSGLSRLLAFVGVAPAALTWLALGAAGVMAATYTAIVAGLATAAVYLAAALTPAPAGPDPAPRESIADLLLVRAPERLADWLMGMDRWVVGAVAAALGGAVRVFAWALAALDEHVVAAPANAIAARLVRAERSVEPIVGAPLGRLVWALLGAAGWVGLAYAFWPRR